MAPEDDLAEGFLQHNQLTREFGTHTQIVRDASEAYGWEPARLRLGPPAPAAIDRMDETFTWLAWLESDDAKIVWLRASGVRWKLITWRMGMGRTTAWQRWVAALMSIASRLNGGAQQRQRRSA